MKFSIDNPFFDVMGHIADLVVLNLFFILTCIPIFTIGTSIRAMYIVLRKMREGTEGTLHRTYFSTFASEFSHTVKSWLVLLGIGALLSFDLYFCVTQMSDAGARILLPVLGAMLFLYLIVFSRVYLEPPAPSGAPSGTVRMQLGSAFSKGIRRFPQTLLMIAVQMVPVLVYQISFRGFAAFMLPLMVVIWFSLSGLICLQISEIGEKKKTWQVNSDDHI